MRVPFGTVAATHMATACRRAGSLDQGDALPSSPKRGIRLNSSYRVGSENDAVWTCDLSYPWFRIRDMNPPLSALIEQDDTPQSKTAVSPAEPIACTADLAECTCPDFCERDHANE